MTVVADFDRAWRLNRQVALRPEPFGALAYHFGTRRLSFLKSRTLLAVVPGARAALERARSLRGRRRGRRAAAAVRAGARDARSVGDDHTEG